MIIESPKERHLLSLRALWQEAFGDESAFIDTFFQAAFSPDRSLAVTEGDEVLAALYWFNCAVEGERVAYLYAIATAKARRGQGLCSALMAETHRRLRTLGYRGALLVPSSAALFGFYEKMGYKTCGRIAESQHTACNDSFPLREIGMEEYARLRRDHLPKGGVVQEKENLRFLSAQAALYAGDGVLLAARKEGSALLGIELLGDDAKAPAILHTLGCTHGRFRHKGEQRAFAMYLPLDAAKPAFPTYFGLAFDL